MRFGVYIWVTLFWETSFFIFTVGLADACFCKVAHAGGEEMEWEEEEEATLEEVFQVAKAPHMCYSLSSIKGGIYRGVYRGS